MQRRLLLAALACLLIAQPALPQSRSAGSLPSREASAAAVAAQERAQEDEERGNRAARRELGILAIALPAFGVLGLVFVLINSGGGSNDSPG